MSKIWQAEDIHWMNLALAQAQVSALAGEVPVGAVLVKDGELIAQDHNRPIGQCDPTAHAEINVLRQASSQLANYRLPGTTLYVTLEPCPMCAGALVHARVDRIVIGALEPRAGAAGSVFQILPAPQLNHRPQVEIGLLAEESSALLKSFFAQRRLKIGSDV